MQVLIYFYQPLATFLPPKKRNRRLTIEFSGKRSVKDLIQSLGVPHTEVGGIHLDGQWVDFSYILVDQNKIDVLPLSPKAQAKDNPIYSSKSWPKSPAFVCDVHLRKLARLLRLVGFDTRYNPDWKDVDLAKISNQDNLYLLTRDRGLLMRNKARFGLYVMNNQPDEQVKEIIERLALGPFIKPFSRCLLCNHSLEKTNCDGEEFETKYKSLVPEKVLSWTDQFHFCPDCHKMYWKGSHYIKLKNKISGYLRHDYP